MTIALHEQRENLGELARLALKLGMTAFGGPAAHIAMLRQEVVSRRRWLTDQQFLDLLGATNLIPGPNSTEMVMYVGRERAGWRGLIAAGVLFITPAALIVLALAWAYVEYGSRPEAAWLLYGIKPVIIAIVGQALWALARTAVQGRLLAALAIATLALFLLGKNELLLLFGAGFLIAVIRNARQTMSRPPSASLLLLLGWLAPVAATAIPVTNTTLFLTFLKIGAVLYGSGYVLLAFLRNDFVERLGWLTDVQLLDAVAVGQLTPGPVFTTATFVGYVVAGLPGAVLATVGIFLPSFAYVALLGPLIPRLRSSRWMSAFLDGVNVAAVGLMAAVTLQLAQAAVVDWITALLAVLSAVALLRYRLNSAWLVLGGALVGITYRLLTA